MSNSETPEIVISKTKEWLEKAVIGLNLCPFARNVYVKNQIRFVVSAASNEDDLLRELIIEMKHLNQTDVSITDTTLLIHPEVLQNFLDYNQFLDVVESALVALDLEGTLQVASFHPQYQFAGTSADDISNFTNRSPYPILHLLREESISKAVDSYPDAESVPDKNIDTMNKLGMLGWKKLNIPSRT
ncbi:MAG: DUF1415 domain-containing protein [Bdellovibrionota bacterium]